MKNPNQYSELFLKGSKNLYEQQFASYTCKWFLPVTQLKFMNKKNNAWSSS